MDDDFDRMLKSALSPGTREEDHAFVSLVSAAIRLDEQLRSARRAIIRSLCIKLAALAAFAAALLWIGQAQAVRDFTADSPSAVAATLILAFAALIALMSSGSETAGFSDA
jgi:hypothetical protein